jgi:murein DD-endopeptidase MepM/ murein hydrolase activator NlpD
MSSTSPREGRDPGDDAGESQTNRHSNRKDGKGRGSPDRTTSKGGSRSQRAIEDAQQSLNSLLNPTADPSQPQIVSQSGATRNHTRGRVAGPAPTGKSTRTSLSTTIGADGHLSSGTRTGDSTTDDPLLAIVPGTHALYDEGEIRDVPRGRFQTGLAVASQHVQTARERAELIIRPSGEPGALGAVDSAEVHASRRAASRWATRYATHLVVLVVVAALVASGGLNNLTVQGAYPQGLNAVEQYTGTDHFEEEAGMAGQDVGSPDFEMALPRTELGGADAAANSRIVEPGAPAPEPQAQPVAPRTDVINYTVAPGDTIESVAAKFNVMPETVMGSNGIFDQSEQLPAGRTLAVPPIDGMYYMPNQGDTLDTIARRFQVDPASVAAYAPNAIEGGAVQPGKPLVVPGGMMPQREIALAYNVKPGDTLRSVASRFGVDVPTLLHSNDIPVADNLQIGSQLKVLPVSGLEYKVEKGDNILSIADKLGVTPQMILDYQPNHLTVDSTLQIDQVIMVPGGSPEREVVAIAAARVEPAARGADNPAAAKAAAPKPEPKKVAPPAPKKEANTPKVGTGRFVWPVQGRITQYFSGRHNGLDIAIRAGTTIVAADSGRVIWSGWRTDGLGYCVMIDHGNGLTTVYGHMLRQPPVYVGQYVSRGQKIGLIGSTGRSTGPHVHFMVKVGAGRNYRNPLTYLGR